MPELVLGPILRHCEAGVATIWVETDAPCEVDVNGESARTFRVEGHDYALVHVPGVHPGRPEPYEVRLDGEPRWPAPGSGLPPSLLRMPPAEELRLVFGSCRVALPQGPPFSLERREDPRGRGPDALHALALTMMEESPERWPHQLMLLGDQIYADDASPGTLEFIRSRRPVDGPHGEDVADFEEYRHLYLDAWGEPAIRWLLSTVPSAMIFDDHDVHDDWNTSYEWRRRVREEEWWDPHIASALSSYWVYQHLGNLSPAELATDVRLREVRAVPDGGEVLREFARRADREPDSARWSFRLDLGRTRLVVVDSRASRVLEPGARQMIDETEWGWLEAQLDGDFEHLLLASSLPVLMLPALHHLEAWSEAVCAGAWGRRAARLGERLRERLDLEHWAAFGSSFERLVGQLVQVAEGRKGDPPASVVLLSGDVHHAYLAEAVVDGRRQAGSVPIHQAVCSPFRNELRPHERAVVRLASTRAVESLARALAAAAGARPPALGWRLRGGKPRFSNLLGVLELDGPGATVRLEEATGEDRRRLRRVLDVPLS